MNKYPHARKKGPGRTHVQGHKTGPKRVVKADWKRGKK